MKNKLCSGFNFVVETFNHVVFIHFIRAASDLYKVMFD